jgi:hypothetical protein
VGKSQKLHEKGPKSSKTGLNWAEIDAFLLTLRNWQAFLGVFCG